MPTPSPKKSSTGSSAPRRGRASSSPAERICRLFSGFGEPRDERRFSRSSRRRRRLPDDVQRSAAEVTASRLHRRRRILHAHLKTAPFALVRGFNREHVLLAELV